MQPVDLQINPNAAGIFYTNSRSALKIIEPRDEIRYMTSAALLIGPYVN
jgi:hypothetical protein